MIGPLTENGLEYVLGNLRAKDDAELHATVWQGSAERTARLVLALPGPKWEARTPDNEPVVVGGIVPIWPGLASGWMWGADNWADVALEVTRAIRRHILPALDRRGVHRIECRPMAGNDAVARWLEIVGFRQEAVIALFGQGREDFLLYARIGHDPSRTH